MTGPLATGEHDSTPILEARVIDKRYGGVHALRGASLEFERGTIHGLVGENGAGKSTLAKILAGVTRPSAGTVAFQGEEVDFRSPRDALKLGITLIAQELALEPERSVFQNVMLGTEPSRLGVLRRRKMTERFRALSESAGFDLPAKARVGSLRQADQQKVEILRALARDAQVIIMDEPTAALTTTEAQTMWRLVGTLRDAGKTIVVVSHFLEEVLEVSDRVTVLRDGRVVLVDEASQLDADGLIAAMVGRTLANRVPERARVAVDAEPVLEVRNVSNRHLEKISLTVRAGEIVGLTGLVGSGRTELARAIFGADPIDRGGEIAISGRSLRLRSPRAAIKAGMALIPESRKEGGLILDRSTAENVSLPHLSRLARLGVVGRRPERERVSAALAKTGVRESAIATSVGNLSGGNQQKALFAKWLMETPKLLIADEPTRGVDVGAKAGIYDLLVRLAEQGMAILMISSEMEEIQALANRIVVMRDGQIAGELAEEAEDHQILNVAFGLGAATESTELKEGRTA